MGIQVVEKGEIKVVGISWNGNISQKDTIPGLFHVMERRLNEITNKTEEYVFIAPFHSRETEITYYVTAPVEKLEQIPEGMVGFTIPRKNYVFATHKGKLEEIENTYKQIFCWMNEYGYEQDHSALSLEIYKEENIEPNRDEDKHIEIYLPVKAYKY
ncbi:effector binding domain-containing protein [Bacillus sp. BRMEA1]|uniref:GyrI-like domain-containing protein n=1 Tax=Neobacillus endophyticus TaxID=2738405 RepID=UPI00156727A2|nr:GyrI-like domain-containing protein [Neobacillus endophyticus]NRD79309.1 effector binding domain-containing protein [Neobacillus endophyticus]